MSRPQSGYRAFLEVTLLAGMMFLVPLGYYYGREHIINAQNKMYYKLFGIKEQHLDEYKKRQMEIKRQDQQKLAEIEQKLQELEDKEDSSSKSKEGIQKPTTP